MLSPLSLSSSKHIVLELESARTEASSRAAGFSSKGEYECSVTDSENKCWVLNEGSMELHAMMLQGGSSYHKGMLTTKALYQFAFVLT